jgi:NAD-dependent SIR2 family protein deacetylase
MFNVSQERLEKIGSELRTDIIGAQSGDYFLFSCVHCGKVVDLTYCGKDPSAPCFIFECKDCKKKYELKFDIPTSHGFPMHPYKP